MLYDHSADDKAPGPCNYYLLLPHLEVEQGSCAGGGPYGFMMRFVPLLHRGTEMASEFAAMPWQFMQRITSSWTRSCGALVAMAAGRILLLVCPALLHSALQDVCLRLLLFARRRRHILFVLTRPKYVFCDLCVPQSQVLAQTPSSLAVDRWRLRSPLAAPTQATAQWHRRTARMEICLTTSCSSCLNQPWKTC